MRSLERVSVSQSLSGDFLIVEMKNITKKFPRVTANDHINLSVRAGEIHGLIGENGAGKTTLMNILYGLYLPDEGEIYIRGRKVTINSCQDAINLGIGMVHQHFMLIPSLTVAENIILGLGTQGGKLVNITQHTKKLEEFSEKFGLKVNLQAKIWQLSVGEQQKVEIIKALYRGAEILIFDEPTSVLTPHETKQFFAFLRFLAKEGRTIIFITHKLDEALSVCDRITVLKAGKVVSTLMTDKTTKEELAKMMIGREVASQKNKTIKMPTTSEEVILEVKNLESLSDRGLPAVKNVSFKLYRGEILGIAGVSGNGQTELAEALTGLRPTRGKVLIDGKNVTNLPPSELIKRGVSYIPGDRTGIGIVKELSVAENLVLNVYYSQPFAKRMMINFSAINSYAEKLISEYEIKVPSKNISARHLSGGNIQRLIIAREFSRNPRIIVAVNPTAGLDIKATEYVKGKLLDMKKSKVGILLISEDLHEILSLSDRIAVIYEGKLRMIPPEKRNDIEYIGLLMTTQDR